MRKGGPLAEWLTDTTIVKVAHNCWGDADLLFANFGLAVLPIWDTAVADSLLLACNHNKSRGLATVIQEYTGHVIDKDFDFNTESFSTRPVTTRMLKYAVEDVLYCSELYRVQRERCTQLHLELLVGELSATRVPPQALRVGHPDKWVARSVALAIAGESSVVCCENKQGHAEIASAEKILPLQEPWKVAKKMVTTMLAEQWGEPIPPVRQLLHSRLRKPVRLGDYLVFVAEMDPDKDYVPSLHFSFAKLDPTATNGRRLSLLPVATFVQRAPTAPQRVFAQWVSHYLRWTRRDRAFKMVAKTGSASFPTAPSSKADQYSCIMVTDGTFVLFLVNHRGQLVFPAVRVMSGEAGHQAALRAI